MANLMLGFPNLIDSATLSGGSWISTLSLEHLKDRVQAKIARSTDTALASTKFDIDLGDTNVIRALALVNHNFSLVAKVRIMASDAANFSTVIHDTDWIEVWPVVYSPESLEWEDDNWWEGTYKENEIEGYSWIFVSIMPGNIRARYWRIEIDDTANGDGFVQIGRVFIGSAWQPDVNLSFGHTMGWETSTDISEALNGTEYFNEKMPLRAVNFSLDWMDEDQAVETVFEIQRRAGISKEVLYIYDPDDKRHAIRRQFLGRIRKLNQIENPNVAHWSASFEIKEIN